MNKIFKFAKDSEIVLSELMLPSYANFSGKIHGGFILSLMDKTAFSSASKFSGFYCVTASVNRVDFLNPIEIGDLVTLKAKVNYVGNSSLVVGIRVQSQKILTGEIKHCNSSYFSMVAKDKNGNNAKVPGLILSNKDEVRRFLRSIEQINDRKNRKTTFNKDNFLDRNYKEELKRYNVKIEYSSDQ